MIQISRDHLEHSWLTGVWCRADQLALHELSCCAFVTCFCDVLQRKIPLLFKSSRVTFSRCAPQAIFSPGGMYPFVARVLGKFIIWAAATMLIQAERKDSSAGVMTLPLAEKMTVKVLKENVRWCRSGHRKACVCVRTQRANWQTNESTPVSGG